MVKFLTLEKEAFGLDISDLSLKMAALKKQGKFFKVSAFNQITLDAGIIEKGLIQNEDALATAVKTLCKNAQGGKIKTKYVVASLPEERSFLQVIQMPEMKEEELKSAVLFEAENYIPLPISEVYLDFQVIAPAAEHVGHLDVLIVATPKKIVNSYVSSLKKAGLVPIALEIESEAVARALIKNEAIDSPVALVDFGKTSTDFIIFSGRSIQFTGSLPVSSEELTAAIAQSLKISRDEAEKLKTGYDIFDAKKDDNAHEILQAMDPILENLAAQIKKYLDFYHDHPAQEHAEANKKIGKILLCGGGADLKGVARLLSEKLGIEAQAANPWANLLPPNPKSGINKNPLSFVTAFGLALRAVKNSNISL